MEVYSMTKEDFVMPTKVLEREETLPARSLRTLSQKDLLEMVEKFEKLGLIVNDNLSVAMLSWDKYENIVDLIQEQKDKIAEMENFIEDIQLSAEYGEDVIRAEKNLNKSYEFDSAEDLFDMIDK